MKPLQNMPRMKQEIEDSYASILMPYAVKKPKEGRRDYQKHEEPHENRGSFQRDRDRIVHTTAFRRLMYKTQVFVNHESDHFRTRLTHTLEVSQLSRGICKSLGLNEDLAEAIAYGHDLGHTPFGHAVEAYLKEEMESRNMGSFYHNEQSVRVVDYLESHPEAGRGLNLTYEVREGILKHNRDRSGIYLNLSPDQPCSSLEGQVVSLTDTIAYLCHDLEDGIRSGVVENAICQNPDVRNSFEELAEIVRKETGILIEMSPYEETYFIRRLIHHFIWQLTQDSWNNIQRLKVESLEDVKRLAAEGVPVIGFSRENEAFFKAFKKRMYRNVYGSRTILLMDTKARELIEKLFHRYEENPELMPPQWYYRYCHVEEEENYTGAAASPLRVIVDYISSMTDRSALEESEQIFNPALKI